MAHTMIGLGLGCNLGPIRYDPEMFMVQGQVGSLDEPGLQRSVPRIWGRIYLSLAMGLWFAVFKSMKQTDDDGGVLQASLMPCLCYHVATLVDTLEVFREDTGAVNVDKLNPTDPAYGHSILAAVCGAAFWLAPIRGANKDKLR